MAEKQPRDEQQTQEQGSAQERATVSFSLASTRRSADPAGQGAQARLPAHPDYVFLREIARGGMGRVLLARETSLEREVAIKTLLPGAKSARFVTEAKVTARLPHPGIPPVYALGKLEDGSPFLAMKLVCGRTLGEELDARKTATTDLPRFLQIFEQVAHAVGFAHSQQIVHRDLKPSNIMVGEFGEVHVMDWGLARDDQRNEDLAPPEIENSSTGALQTKYGTVLGTPAYMAPEQARGEIADPRADVFALGGILATILTGRPPFEADSVAKTVELAALGQTGEVLDLLQNCDAEPQLLEIARKCLQVDPARRPQNGSQVAELIGAYREGVENRLRQSLADQAASEAKAVEEQRRRKSLRIAAAIVILVLLAGVLGTTVGLVNANTAWNAEAARADGERRAKVDLQKEYDRAESALGEVRASIDRYVDLVENEDLLKEPGFQGLVPKLLGEALSQYQTYVAQHADESEPEAQQEVAASLVRIGKIHQLSGDPNQAITAYEKALAIGDDLLQEKADSAEYQDLVATCSGNLGQMYRSIGNPEKAITAASRAWELRQSLARTSPQKVAYQIAQTRAGVNLANLYKRTGKPDDALKLYQQAMKVLKPLTEQHPELPEGKNDLAKLYINLGDFHASTGDRSEALRMFQQAVELQTQLVEKSENGAASRYQLSLSQSKLGNLYATMGQPPQAVTNLESAVTSCRELVTEKPNSAFYRDALAKALSDAGMAYKAAGESQQALDSYRQGLEISEQLTREYPEVAEYRAALARLHVNLSSLYKELNRAADATTEMENASKTWEKLASDSPTFTEYVSGLAASRFNLGEFYGTARKSDEAREAYEAALAAYEKLVDANSSATAYRDGLANCLASLGGLDQAAGNTAQAHQAYERALEIRLNLVKDNPNTKPYKIYLSILYFRMAQLQPSLSEEPADTIELYDQAVATIGDVLRQNPKDPTVKRIARSSYAARAQQQQSQDHWQLAADDWQAAMQIESGAMRTSLRSQLARALAHTQDHAGTLREVQVLLTKADVDAAPPTPADRYLTAGTLALAADKVQADSDLAVSEREERAEQYARQAVELLQSLADESFFATKVRRQTLDKDEALKFIRERDDFKQMQQGLDRVQ